MLLAPPLAGIQGQRSHLVHRRPPSPKIDLHAALLGMPQGCNDICPIGTE
jgi:hypothetical protein